jgi:GT2 family glycosyltransferase
MFTAHLAAQVITALCSLLAVGWLWQGLRALRGMPRLPDLTRLDLMRQELPSADGGLAERDAGGVPDLTVIVPACNEEESIEATLRSLLASTGVRLQIVAVDDRSTDETGALMDAVAEEALAAGGAHTLEVIHNRELPEGWLGKVHALALGVERARAPWLLFTDGDMRFDARAAGLALNYARAERADHVVLLFSLDFESVGEAAAFAAFQALASWNMRLWKVADAEAEDFFGAGGFNLVRREVLDGVGGLEGLRMEVIEDLRLGWKIKRGGFRSRIVVGAGLVRIRWIDGALGMVGLLEKNGFAAMRYRVGTAVVASVGFAVQILLPLVAMVLGGWAAVAGVLTYGFIGLTYFANRRVTQVSAWVALLFAPATGVLLYAMVRSVVLTMWRGGVVWRGTRYPLAELRRHAGRGW